MDPIDYFSLPDNKFRQQAQWGNNHWQDNMPNWDITPIAKETPLWQYETPTMNHGGGSAVYYATQTPLSPSYTNTSSCHSTLNSPLTAGFPQDARYTPQPVTPLYENISKPSNRPVSLQLQPPVAVANELMDEDGDSDTCSWEPKVAIPRPTRPMHRRSASANEVLARNAKRAHTVVEKNYRERLNDKINDLAQYLFETSSDSRSKPSKSLVMTRAKERLKKLESRNAVLENEVAALRQRIAILDHVVASSSVKIGCGNSHVDMNQNLPTSSTRVKMVEDVKAAEIQEADEDGNSVFSIERERVEDC